jgi:hypothetical protein
MTTSLCGRAILEYCAHGLEPLPSILETIQGRLKKVDQVTIIEELVRAVGSGYLECYFDSGGAMVPRKAVTPAELVQYMTRGPEVRELMGLQLAELGYYFETTDLGINLINQGYGHDSLGGK